MDKEAYFLNLLQQSGITGNLNDDCTSLSTLLVNNKDYIIATDSFVENIHFKMQHEIIIKDCPNKIHKNQWLSYKNLAKKAFLINISDILSSGALPRYALLSIVLHKTMQNTSIKETIEGITHICKAYGIKLIGGDTMRGHELSFHITMIGHLISKYLHRNAVKEGDLLAYTSSRKHNLGTSLKTLKRLLRYGANTNIIPHHIIESQHRDSRFTLPFLRMNFLKKSHRLLHACMDISDGLANEIKRLESQNKLVLLPYHPLKKDIYQSGEEYELLFSFKQSDLVALQRIARSTRTKLHVIGKFGRYRPKYLHTIHWHT